jgi:hypothetical protein
VDGFERIAVIVKQVEIVAAGFDVRPIRLSIGPVQSRIGNEKVFRRDPGLLFKRYNAYSAGP